MSSNPFASFAAQTPSHAPPNTAIHTSSEGLAGSTPLQSGASVGKEGDGSRRRKRRRVDPAGANTSGPAGTSRPVVVRAPVSSAGRVAVLCKLCRSKIRIQQIEQHEQQQQRGDAGADGPTDKSWNTSSSSSEAKKAWLTSKQSSLGAWLATAKQVGEPWACNICTLENHSTRTTCSACGTERSPEGNDDAQGHVDDDNDDEDDDDERVCSRCRLPLDEKVPQRLQPMPREDPIVSKLKAYKRVAGETGAKFLITDAAAAAVMRQPCSFCGKVAPQGQCNGLTRLRILPSTGGAKHGVMGDFADGNVDAACARCNLAKGVHGPYNFVGICRTIATHMHTRALGIVESGSAGKDDSVVVNDDVDDVRLLPVVLRRKFAARGLCHDGAVNFGRFDHLFRNNISRKSRSAYLSDSKTFSMTNEEFREIADGSCYFCGKQTDASVPHFNGLDRLNSTRRIYTTTSVVACCSTCNM